MTKKSKAILLFLIMAGVLTGGLLFFRSETLPQKLINVLGKSVITKCEKEQYKPTCYENQIFKFAKFLKMEDSFRLTKEVQKKDQSFAYCHVLAHKISFLEAQRRPSEWKEIITECPFTMCNYGCLHGSLIERYRGEVLDDSQLTVAKEELKDICEPRGSWNPTEVDKNMCYHALGHLGMYMTGADIRKSSNFCQAVGVKEDGRDYYEICIEGVFMTVFQGVDPEDIVLVASIKPEKEEVRGFCNGYSGLDYEACNRESYPLFTAELKTSNSISNFCSYSQNEHGQWKCFATLIGNVAVDFLETKKIDESSAFCLSFSGKLKSQCFANMAVRMVQIEPGNIGAATGLCEEADKHGIGKECFGDLDAFILEAGIEKI